MFHVSLPSSLQETKREVSSQDSLRGKIAGQRDETDRQRDWEFEAREATRSQIPGVFAPQSSQGL